MPDFSKEKKIEEIYLVLSDLRYLLHKDNTLEEYEQIAVDYYKRVAVSVVSQFEID